MPILPTLDTVEIYEHLLRIWSRFQCKFFKGEMELLIIVTFVKLAQGTYDALEIALRNNKTGFPHWDNEALGRCCIMSVLDK